MLEVGGYVNGKKKAVIGPDYHNVILRMPITIYQKLKSLADSHKNSINREIMILIEERHEHTQK